MGVAFIAESVFAFLSLLRFEGDLLSFTGEISLSTEEVA
jgi:hypothetical protein